MNTGDYSRFTFDPRDNVRTVMVQQGRPLTDADLNEASEATLSRIETEAIDVIGAEGAPLIGGGFRIVADGEALTTTEASDPRNQPGSSGNVQNAPFAITAGRCYVDGLQIENHQMCGPLLLAPAGPAKYPSQPMPLPADALAGTGNRLVYLRATLDHLTAVESPRLLDPALGDADTSARAVVSWQLGLLDSGGAAACGDPVPDWTATVAASSGRMSVSLDAATPSTDPCRLTPGGGYVRPENLLYRVQVDGGIVSRNCADGPRFGRDGLRLKVSRNNAMEVARIATISGNTVTVTPSSRDGVPTFRVGEWVEILKDGSEARGDAAAGWTQVLEVAGDVLTLVSVAGAAAGDRVRLWSFDLLTVPNLPGDALAVEDGLSVTFPAGGEYRRGDYWLIPARYAVGPDYWARLTGTPLPPFGPRVEYARLAMLTLDAGVIKSVTDCRTTFEPLTQLLSMHYAGGDGQTVSPVGIAAGGFAPAPSQLRVGVRVGRKPVVGAALKFDISPAPAAATAGLLVRVGGGPGAAQGVSVIAVTGADGVAAVNWSLNLNDPVQRVTCHLLDATDANGVGTLPVPIEFSAGLNRASLVAYTPGACNGLNGIDQVQTALDKLCNDLATIAVPKQDFMFVTQIIAIGTGGLVINNQTIDPKELAEGLVFSFSEELGMNLAGSEPILKFWIDLPYPPEHVSRTMWGQFMGAPDTFPLLGTIELAMTGRLSINGTELHWTPTDMSRQFLQTAGDHRFGLRSMPGGGPVPNFEEQPIRAYFSLRGDAIWSRQQDPRRYLNGEVLMFDDGQHPFNNDPKDFDPQRAADYRMWFFLGG
jgi:hypothetical protein